MGNVLIEGSLWHSMIFIFYLWYDGCSFAIWEIRVRVTEIIFLKYLNIRLCTLTLPKPALVGVSCIRYTLLCGKCFGSHERWITHTSLHWSHLSWWTPSLSRITLLVELLGVLKQQKFYMNLCFWTNIHILVIWRLSALISVISITLPFVNADGAMAVQYIDMVFMLCNG